MGLLHVVYYFKPINNGLTIGQAKLKLYAIFKSNLSWHLKGFNTYLYGGALLPETMVLIGIANELQRFQINHGRPFKILH